MYLPRPQTGNIFRSMDSLVLRHPIICTENNVRSFNSAWTGNRPQHRQAAIGQEHNKGQATYGWKGNKKGKLFIRDRRNSKRHQLGQTQKGQATTVRRQQRDRRTLGDRQQQGQAYNSGQATSGERQ